MTKVILSGASLTGASLVKATLDYAVMNNSRLYKANLTSASMDYTVLNGASLSGSKIRGMNMKLSHWTDTNKSCLIIPDIHQAVYKAASAEGALDMGVWHSPSCTTTHCRAGWVIRLAGKVGQHLDREYGTSLAAALIYLASDPTMTAVPNFHTTNEIALADMKSMAETEAARVAQ